MTPFTEGQEERIRAAVRARLMESCASGRDLALPLVVQDWDNIEHIVHCGTSILCTKWGIGYPGGSFVQAVVNNDLMEAFGRADATNINAIRFYVSLLYNQSYIE